jgi:fused signal recognition particle receptor
VTNPETPERTRGGLAGRLAGRFKQAAGSLLGDKDLAREGRLQEAHVDAEADAEAAAQRARQADAGVALDAARTEKEIERERLENDVSAREREEAIARDRVKAEQAAQVEAGRREAAADAQRRAQQSAAQAAERSAEQERLAAAQEAAALEREARRAEATAEAIDPEER